MSSVEEQVRELIAIEAIKRLQSNYYYSVDHQDFEAWGNCFAEDAVMEVPASGMVVNGRENIVASVSQAYVGAWAFHLAGLPHIEMTSPTTATGRWALFDYFEWSPKEDGSPNGFKGYAWVTVKYAEIDGAWQIVWQSLDRTRTDPLG